MNNRFKFRAWDSHHKMWYVKGVSVNLDGRVYDMYLEGHDDNVIIQQYTGLKDNADKEIYEGDIVSYKGYKGQVSFLAGMFIIDYPDQTDSGPIGFLQTVDIEVIGNIFENKELLNV